MGTSRSDKIPTRDRFEKDESNSRPRERAAATNRNHARAWPTSDRAECPVLAPLLGKLVILEMGFGRRATTPVEDELVALRENVSAVVTDPKRNIAHQCDPPG